MKRVIFPVAIAVVFIIIVKFFVNPTLEAGGVFILALLGAIVGVVLNSKIFKDANEVKEVKDAKDESKHVADSASH